MEFLYTRRFLKSLSKLDEKIQDDVINSVERFRGSINHKELKLHKLSGKLKIYHSFSANYSYRIIIKMKKTEIYFIDVGDHSVYE
jgi:mRNA-degrading endonuclease YafQ of YafQ-DinJ toxin-antitoxin module